METMRSHYPSYDVMALQEEWDPHTKEIVLKRLGPFPKAKFLVEHEKKLLTLIAGHLTYDNRTKIFDWVLHYIDQKMYSEIGESQRKPDVPPEKVLIREGLKFIDNVAQKRHKTSFVKAGVNEQFQILADVQTGSITGIPEWPKALQKELFKKFAEIIISGYYSHPTVWSEIGYGGPAYPRGYVRVEFGLADPWEAKKEDGASYGFGEEGNENGE